MSSRLSALASAPLWRELQAAVKERARFLPVALRGGERDLQRLGDVFERKAAEVPHLHDLVRACIDLGQLPEGGVQRLDVRRWWRCFGIVAAQGDMQLGFAALARTPPAARNR
ncbi:MAG: hypothetical protein WDO56_08905 [Gammaproteobacteria bacterium]